MLNWIRKPKESDATSTGLLSAYLDGALSTREQSWLERQLQNDAALQAELDELQRTVQTLSSAPVMPLPRNFTLDPAVHGRQIKPRAYVFPFFRAATMVTALLFVFLFAGDILLGATNASHEVAMEPAQTVPLAAPGENGDLAQQNAEQPAPLRMEVQVEEEIAAGEEIEVEGVTSETLGLKAVEYVTTTEETESAANDVAAEIAADQTEETLGAAASGAAPTDTAASDGEIGERGTADYGEGGTALGESVEQESLPQPTPAPMGTPEATIPVAAAQAPPATLTAIPTPDALPKQWVEEPSTPAPSIEEPIQQPPARRPMDWFNLAQIGAGLLAVSLLLLTLLARRFDW